MGIKRLRLIDAVNCENTTLGLGQFLDDFKKEDNKYELIKDEPVSTHASRKTLCYAAATAHKLAVDNDLEVPEWVRKAEYIMPEPVYAHNTSNEKYQELLKETSFAEFASRNLYYGDNAISRC
jgi:hypothetical protein